MKADTTYVRSKAGQLRTLLQSPNLEFLMEAHNGISARIVEETGFAGIWASGLAISAQFGVRDSNEASWTQVVDMLEFMSDATRIPILLDGDTGYGNFNNMRRLVKKLEQRGIAGVCIEDKLFPKANSFINSARQPLCDIDEFCGKIKAGKDSQLDSDFCIVARVEALIAGWGMDEAIRRADAYRDAGADAILIHSSQSRADEILEFTRLWENRLPLVIVPTKYYSTPTDVFRRAGISVSIWANHMIRAAVARMETIAQQVYAASAITDVEDQIAAVDELFRLQGADELLGAEKRYAADKQDDCGAIVLAATRGQGLDAMTEDRPKVMLPVGQQPLLQRLLNSFKMQNVYPVTVVAGYKAETINLAGIDVVHNPDYLHSGELASLACAREALAKNTVILYGDLLFRRYILRDLLDMREEIVVVVDSALPPESSPDFRDLAYCSYPDDHSLIQEDVELVRVVDRATVSDQPPSGRWIGMLRAAGQGRARLLEALDELQAQSDFDRLGIPDLLNHLVTSGTRIQVLYIHGHWLDVNRIEDLARASDFAHGKSDLGSYRPG